VRSVVIGEGQERESILRAARAHGVADRLTLTGWLDEPVRRAAEFDVFVLPSRNEGFPLVILEAMLAGVPVVATDVGSVGEAVEDGVTGLLVQSESPDALAQAIRRLLDDAELRTRLAGAARARASTEFTSDVMARRYLDVFRAAAGARRVKRRAPKALHRPRQARASFVPGDLLSGYYNDLRAELRDRTPEECLQDLHTLAADRTRANPVSIAQLGLASWQSRADDTAWIGVFEEASNWLRDNLEADGSLPYLFDMQHTYPLKAPWRSAMAQGQAASALARAALTFDGGGFADAAVSAVRPLLARDSGLIASSSEGDVLQEYPTDPASHVLNGWIFALWGLHDVAALAQHTAAASAFAEGTRTLVRRIGLYDTGRGWSRYDLYPHPLVHVAAPFYHHLHVAQLEATADLTGEETLRRTAQLWAAGARRPTTYLWAVGRKVAFRLARPRGRRA
jgi:hypothetical protein